MMDWYKFTPVDTLFFKGAEPMNLGENHTTSQIFPPPAHTLCGALRTAVLVQNSVSIEAYAHGKAPGEIYETIGRAGDPAPFNLIGPLFMLGTDVYVPAPYLWFKEKDSGSGKVKIIKGESLQSRLLKTDTLSFIWARGVKGEMVSIGGMWIRRDDLHSSQDFVEVKKCEDFFENEPRTGIALEKNRSVREGHLYSFNHARLKREVSLVFGADRNLPLQHKGVLKIGGEQRFGWYEEISEEHIRFQNEGNFYLSLSILEGTDEANNAVVATGKVQYLGGWDLHAGFHKPMKGYFPAGTVCREKLNNNFIAIKGVETC